MLNAHCHYWFNHMMDDRLVQNIHIGASCVKWKSNWIKICEIEMKLDKNVLNRNEIEF